MSEPVRIPVPDVLIGVYRRVSDPKQVGNERFEAMGEDMGEYVASLGYKPVFYDEGAASGATMHRRPVFRDMLDDLAAGRIHGLASPDVKRFTRGGILDDTNAGQRMARTLIDVKGLLITYARTYRLINPRDLQAFADEVNNAARERTEIALTFWQGQIRRARKTADGREGAYGRHRTMLGYRLELLHDAAGRPVITAKGIAKRVIAKDHARADDMRVLSDLFERCWDLAELTAALKAYGVVGPSRAREGGWSKREIRTILEAPLFWGRWALVRNPRALLWYGLGHSETWDPKSVVSDRPDLAYWTEAEARRWHGKFLGDDDSLPGPNRRNRTFRHPLLGLLHCANCHSPMLGKGSKGYICRGYNTGLCKLPGSTMYENTARRVLEDQLLPLLGGEILALRDRARAALRRHDASGAATMRLVQLDDQERALYATVKRLAERRVETPATIDDEFVAIAQERTALKAQMVDIAAIDVGVQAVERALARLGDDVAQRLRGKSYEDLARLYRGLVESAEIEPAGRTRAGGRLVAYTFHTGRKDIHPSLMELIVRLAA